MDVSQLVSNISSQNLLHCSVNFSFTNLQQALLDLTNALSLAHAKIQNLEQSAERSINEEERLRQEVARIKEELLIRPSYDEVKKDMQTIRDQQQKFSDRIDNSLTFINSDIKMINHRVDDVSSHTDSFIAGVNRNLTKLEEHMNDHIMMVTPLISKFATSSEVEGVIERHKKNINEVETQLKWFVTEQTSKWQNCDDKQRQLQADQDKLKEGFSVIYRDLNLLPEDLHHAREDIETLKGELEKTNAIVKKQLTETKSMENQTVLDLRTDLSDLAGVVENIAVEMRKTQDNIAVTKQVLEAEIDRRRKEDTEDIEVVSLKREPLDPIDTKKESTSPQSVKSPPSFSPIPSLPSIASVGSKPSINPQDMFKDAFPSPPNSAPNSNSSTPRRSPKHLETIDSNISIKRISEQETPQPLTPPPQIPVVVEADIKDSAEFKNMMSMIEEHSKQLSYLLQTKADLSAVNALLQEKEEHVHEHLTPNTDQSLSLEEIARVKESLNKKVSREDLEKLKRMLQREIVAATKMKSGGSIEYASEGAITKSPFRCLACDRLIWKTPTGGSPYVTDNRHDIAKMKLLDSSKIPVSVLAEIPVKHLGANIAFKRWQVREVLRQQQVDELQKIQIQAQQTSLEHSSNNKRLKSLPTKIPFKGRGTS